jgi:hypothetical protein
LAFVVFPVGFLSGGFEQISHSGRLTDLVLACQHEKYEANLFRVEKFLAEVEGGQPECGPDVYYPGTIPMQHATGGSGVQGRPPRQ